LNHNVDDETPTASRSPCLGTATELYGGIGVATTMLFWLHIVGRLVIGAATLNASLVERRDAGPATP